MRAPVVKSSRAIPHPSDLIAVAENVVWFKPPLEALDNTHDFLAHVMTYGTLDDVLIAEKHFCARDFRAALEHAPPGVFDIRSWHYWNIVCGRTPVPPLPQRKIPGVEPLPQSHSRWS